MNFCNDLTKKQLEEILKNLSHPNISKLKNKKDLCNALLSNYTPAQLSKYGININPTYAHNQEQPILSTYETLPFDILDYIARFFDVPTIVSYCSTNSNIRSRCDEDFWYRIFKREYPAFNILRENPPMGTWRNSVLNPPPKLDIIDVIWNVCTNPENAKSQNTNINLAAGCYGCSNFYEPYVGIDVLGPITLSLESPSGPEKITINKFVINTMEILDLIYEFYQTPISQNETYCDYLPNKDLDNISYISDNTYSVNLY